MPMAALGVVRVDMRPAAGTWRGERARSRASAYTQPRQGGEELAVLGNEAVELTVERGVMDGPRGGHGSPSGAAGAVVAVMPAILPHPAIMYTFATRRDSRVRGFTYGYTYHTTFKCSRSLMASPVVSVGTSAALVTSMNANTAANTANAYAAYVAREEAARAAYAAADRSTPAAERAAYLAFERGTAIPPEDWGTSR